MTHIARRYSITVFYAVALLLGLGAGHVLDVAGHELASSAPSLDPCSIASAMRINPCADLDTSGVTDLRDATPVSTVRFMIYTDRDQLVADCLIARNWKGLPDDGLDAVYAPQSEIAACQAQVG